MPTVFSHAIFASAIGTAYAGEPTPWSFWVLTASCAMLPVVDAVAFAALVGLAEGMFAFGKRSTGPGRLQLSLYFTLVTLSQPLLDALTNGGRGVALFAPFSAERYFFPWRPIEVSPIGMGFFSSRGLEVLVSEIVWVWLPAMLIFVGARMYRKSRRA